MLYNGSKALISDKSVIFGNAMLSGCFQIYDNVRISQNAKLYEEISLLWNDISKKASSPEYCETAKQICSFLREIPYINLKEKIEALSKKSLT